MTDASNRAAEMLDSRQFQPLLVWLRDQLRRQESAPNGQRFYEAILDGIFARLHAYEGDPRAAEAELELYREFSATFRHDADAAAILATALQIVGTLHRGNSLPHNVSRRAWERMQDFFWQAEELLDRHAGVGQDRALWHRTKFMGATWCSHDPDEINALFETYRRFDPWNFSTYRERAFQLRPSWYGSYDAIEEFAGQSANQTCDLLGQAVYADIYLSLSDSEGLPGKMHMNWARLRAGLYELQRLFPSQTVANNLAFAAHCFGDHYMVQRIFHGPMKSIALNVWGDEMRAYRALAEAESIAEAA